MELSKRLQTVASLVTTGNRIADIGTDHAYIPIYLTEKNVVPSAIAMDINKGPLERAKEHVSANKRGGQIDLRLSDGLEKLKPGEADTAIIAGMGGGLVIKILTDYWDITCSLKECILQPQSEIAKVRAFLLEKGFCFIQEEMVLDEGKYYPMMKVIPPTSDSCSSTQNWTEVELRYGKMLLEERHPVLKQFLEREETIRRKILKNLEIQQGENIAVRRAELEEELEYIQKGLEYYAV